MDEKRKPVINSNDIKVKKKNKAENFLSNFLSDIIVNVVAPAVERTTTNLVSDIFDASKRAFLSSLNFDNKSGKNNTSIVDKPSYISYNDYYNRFNNGGPATFTPTIGDYAYNEITFNSRGQAEIVRSYLFDILRDKKIVTVGDYYSLCGIPTAPTDFNFGWVSLGDATITMHPQGYRIKLPRAMPVDR